MEKNMKKIIYIYFFNLYRHTHIYLFELFYTRKEYNIVNQLYFNKNFFSKVNPIWMEFPHQ